MCTSILLQNNKTIVLAQNYDYAYRYGAIMTNSWNVKKIALTDDFSYIDIYSTCKAGARWTSQFCSVTFNMFGREFPNFGMNEAGVAVCSMVHVTEEARPLAEGAVINELQWVQRQLDCHASVEELIEQLPTYQYTIDTYPMHYHVADRFGDAAIIALKRFGSSSHSAKKYKGLRKYGL